MHNVIKQATWNLRIIGIALEKGLQNPSPSPSLLAALVLAAWHLTGIISALSKSRLEDMAYLEEEIARRVDVLAAMARKEEHNEDPSTS